MIAFVACMIKNNQLQLYDLCVNRRICTLPMFSPGKISSKLSSIQFEGYQLTKKSSVTFVGVGKDVAVELPRILKQVDLK
jgi:hypothetical protein